MTLLVFTVLGLLTPGNKNENENMGSKTLLGDRLMTSHTELCVHDENEA